MTFINNQADYWDDYAARAADESPGEAFKHAFRWTQYKGHGPGDELLAEPTTALELGSGCGDAVAALAAKGVDATGVDISRAQCAHARRRWGHLSGAGYIHADAADYLTDTERRWEAIYSIWGALWFTDPQSLLPLIRDRLVPGGKLVFSHAPAVPGSYGVQGMYGGGLTGRQVWVYRWAYEPTTWADLLYQHGFTNICARVQSAPELDHLGTLIVEGERESR